MRGDMHRSIVHLTGGIDLHGILSLNSIHNLAITSVGRVSGVKEVTQKPIWYKGRKFINYILSLYIRQYGSAGSVFHSIPVRA